ncbi:MAG: N4-gp56 family major capsid protein [Ruminococcaceae bacterium]|nr:N4-gp56 family major capsid protein [Oscillospiraceae bacterium]
MKFNKINLQLFAEPVVQTTLLNAEGNNLSAEMKTFYDMTLIDEASANLVHDQFGQKRPIPANGGKTIEFRKFSSLPKATTAITEGVTPAGNKLNVTTITATVAQYGDYITQSDVLELTALDNTILEATKLLGKQAGSTLDTIVRDKIHSENKSIFYASKSDGTEVDSRAALDDTCALTVKEIQAAVAFLRGQNAPTINGKYVAIIHPYVAYDLMRDPEWINAHKYANPTNLYEGEIGEVGGVRFVQTTEAKIHDGGVFSTLVFGENAYGVTEISGGGLQTIVKQKGSAGTADPLDQRSSVGYTLAKVA